MQINDWILTAVAAAFALWFIVAWLSVGLYGVLRETDSRSRVASRFTTLEMAKIRRLVREDEIYGYLDEQGIFHCHFYEAESSQDAGSGRPLVFVRYFPDAFGKPVRNRLQGKRIKWCERPDWVGIQAGRRRFLVRPVSRRIADDAGEAASATSPKRSGHQTTPV